MKLANLQTLFSDWLAKAVDTLTRVDTLYQVLMILAVYLTAYGLTTLVRNRVPLLQEDEAIEEQAFHKTLLQRLGKLLFPITAIFLLKIAVENSSFLVENSWVMKLALAVAVLLFFNSFVNLLIKNEFVAKIFRLVGMPIVFLHVVGALDAVIKILDGIHFDAGDIKISAYGLIRTLIFGSLLFWLGRVSNKTGQNLIRKQESLDIKSRELFAKLYEILLFVVVAILILEVMGINLTALAVFGGAVGVGLGFGLQAIASNFISGVIIIMDKSVTVGDYVQMEDGKAGTVTHLNMRSTTLETFDGKDIVIPNEKFITSAFTNWTHKNKKQRYRVDFSVGYQTDIRAMVPIIKAVVAEHPEVISGAQYTLEEQPDCEIDSFGDSGINMFVEYWMEDIDDGKHRVSGDLMLTILETLRAHDIEIPFPQREVRILNDQPQGL